MIHLDLTRHADHALLRVRGAVDSRDAFDALNESLAFVPEGDHLIVDLTELSPLTAPFAGRLSDQLIGRTMWSEVVIVVDDADVALALVLEDVDRVAPIVHTIGQAVAVLEARCGRRLDAGMW